MTVCRMCAVCRTRRPKNELLRIVKSPNGKIYIDNGGKADGRGMYICRDENCLKNAEKRRVAERAFKTRTENIYREIDEFCKSGGEINGQ